MSIKDLHRGVSLLRDVRTFQDLLDGQPYHYEIGFQRHVFHIPDIELELLCPRDGITPMTLCPAADARTHLMAAGLLFGIERKILYQQRTRSDQSHVTFQNIQQLGQLIDGRGTYKTAHFSQSLFIRQQMTTGVTLVRHGLIFDNPEDLAILARSFL